MRSIDSAKSAPDAVRVRHTAAEFASLIQNAIVTSAQLEASLKTASSNAAKLRKQIADAVEPRKLRSVGFAKRVTLYDTELRMPGQRIELTEDVSASADNQGNKQVVQGWVFRNTNDRREMMLHVAWPEGYEVLHWERNDKALTGSLVQPKEVHEMAGAINRAAAASGSIRREKRARQAEIQRELSDYLGTVAGQLLKQIERSDEHIHFLQHLHNERTAIHAPDDKRLAKRLAKELVTIKGAWTRLYAAGQQARAFRESSIEHEFLDQSTSEPEADVDHDPEMQIQSDHDEETPPPARRDEAGVREAGELLAVLGRLGEMHAAGFLTDEEFAFKKQEILRRL